MATSKRGPASVPAQPTKDLAITLKVAGFRQDCTTCCRLADQMQDLAAAGRLYGASDLLDQLADHVDDLSHWPAAAR